MAARTPPLLALVTRGVEMGARFSHRGALGVDFSIDVDSRTALRADYMYCGSSRVTRAT